MNKVIAQEQVFELIKQKYKNQGNITSDDIYNILNSYGLTKEDKQLRVKKNLFDFKGTIKTKGILTDNDIHFVPFSSATGEINSTSISMLSPGITISTPWGNVITPVTSVVLK